MKNVKGAMMSIIEWGEGLDEFQEVEVAVMVRRGAGGKSVFIRMQSCNKLERGVKRNLSQEEGNDAEWF